MARPSHNGHHDSLKQSFADVLHDVSDLAELQWELLGVDVKEARQRAATALWTLLAAGVVTLGLLPVLLLGVAQLLVLYTGLPEAWANLCIAIAVAVACGIAAKVAANRLSRAAAGFGRSREELRQNIRWMKRVIKAHGRPERTRPTHIGN
jgi:hypothetical protein